jgi:Phytanoyl-CoA dioxygenase (PhyH)
MTDTVLSAEQVDSFVEHGYVRIAECFTRADAQPWLDEAWVRLGYERDDPSTWAEQRVHMPSLRHVEVADFAPKVWGAACQLLGGEDRIEQPYTWGNGFIANLGLGVDRPWEPPSAASPDWHKDGDFFRHFLDSPEQGLLTIVLWSDIEERGGGTFIAPDSVAPVARLLERRREGVLPDDFPYDELIAQCSTFVETTGRLGDVVLMHPYMLHASSQNHRGTARFITNPPIALREPMRFDRDDPAEHSPVERAVLRALGVERLDYRPAAPREDVVPERVLRQERMREEEAARLAEASS